MNVGQLALDMLEMVLYVIVGVVVFAISIKLIDTLAPFSVRKEIEEDQNVALGIIMGAIIVGLALIVGAVMLSDSSILTTAASAE